MIKKIPVILLLILHFSFLFAAIFANQENLYFSLFLILIVIFLGYFYLKNFKSEKSRIRAMDLLLVCLAAIGALFCYGLNEHFGLGAVLAAGITGVFASFLPYLNRRSDLLRELPVAIYCGAFAGMTAPFVANGYTFIAGAGIITGIVLVISKTTLHGFGGKLGTIAFGGVSFMSLMIYLFY